MRARTRARELALQFLFQLDVQGDGYRDELSAFLGGALDGKGGAVVESTVLIARRLGISVVAEGVETAEQAKLLSEFVSEEELLPLSQSICRVFARLFFG